MRKAKHGGYCLRCGVWAEAGNDLILHYNMAEDAEEWRVMHSDQPVCEANIAAAKEAERRRAADKEAEQKRSEELGREYLAWQAETLAGLVKTFAQPAIADWEHVRTFGKEVAGTWYTTGDAWYRAEVDGQTIWRCAYGNALVYYAPQSLVDQWCEEEYAAMVVRNGEARAAAWVLTRAGQGCIWDDIADRLLELHGPIYFEDLVAEG